MKVLNGGGWSTPRPGRFAPGKETRYPLYKWLCGPQGSSGRVRKVSPALEFDPRTVQPVGSCYTDSYPGPQYVMYDSEWCFGVSKDGSSHDLKAGAILIFTWERRKKTTKNLSTAGVAADILTQHLLNTC